MLAYICDWCLATVKPHMQQTGFNEGSEPQRPPNWSTVLRQDICATCTKAVKDLANQIARDA